MPVRPVLMLLSHLSLGLESVYFNSSFPTKILQQHLFPHAFHFPCPSHSPWLIKRIIFSEKYKLWSPFYVYWTVLHHLDSWIKIDQLYVTCFIISLFTAQHVSNVSASIFRSLRLIVDLFHGLYCSGSMCVGVTVWFGWGGVVSLCRLKPA